ncbi:cytochrome c [soil metagenome]
MTIRPGCLSFAVAVFLAAEAVAAPVQAQNAGSGNTGRSTLDGVYTAQQATRGETIFRNICGNCHATSEFSGSGFQTKWSATPVFTFFEQIRSTMPLDNPGGLSAAEYSAVIAYILKLNAYPAGPRELPAADSALKQIRFEKQPPQQ